MSDGFRVGLGGLLALLATNAWAADNGVFQWQTVGAQAYTDSCSACHQPSGQGVPDTFPALAGFAPNAWAADNGVFQWQTVGAQAYTDSCSACHQPSGQGVPDTFPALAGYAP